MDSLRRHWMRPSWALTVRGEDYVAVLDAHSYEEKTRIHGRRARSLRRDVAQLAVGEPLEGSR